MSENRFSHVLRFAEEDGNHVDVPQEDDLMIEEVDEQIVWIADQILRADDPVQADDNDSRRNVEPERDQDRGETGQALFFEQTAKVCVPDDNS